MKKKWLDQFYLNPINYILNLLNKPFPVTEGELGAFNIIAIVSVFVTFFLFIFQPFGISTLDSGKFGICLGFGIATFIASLIFELFVSKVLKIRDQQEKWTFAKWSLYNLGIMLVISLANFLYARVLLFGYIEWELFPHMLYGTFMIGIIPITVLGGLSLLIYEQKFQNIANGINQKQSSNQFNEHASNQQIFNIPINQIKYLEALQNYVSIGYVNDQNEFKKSTQRGTLKHILQNAHGGSIIRSHRSYLVNKDAILSASGNAQGLLLELEDCNIKIPVSRSYVNAFKDME